MFLSKAVCEIQLFESAVTQSIFSWGHSASEGPSFALNLGVKLPYNL